MSSDSEGLAEEGSKVARACDACRKKKTRCDKKIPCNGCKRAGLVCEVTAPPPTEKKQRIHVSQNFEHQITTINDRLETIERLLRLNLDERHSNRGTSTLSISTEHSPRAPQLVVTPHSELSPEEPNANRYYVGESSLLSATTEARHVLTRGLSPEAGSSNAHNSPQSNPALAKAVAALNKLMSSPLNDELYFPSEMVSEQMIDLNELPLPPLERFFEALLAKYETDGNIRGFFTLSPLPLKRFRDILKESEGIHKKISIASFICINGILPMMYQFPNSLKSLEEYGYSKALLDKLLDVCIQNCRVASKRLVLHMAPTLVNIQALLLAANIAQDCASPGESWTYISWACRLCIAMGLHTEAFYARLSPVDPEGAEEHLTVFWWCYMMDKMQAINFGRTPAIHEYDIGVEFPWEQARGIDKVPHFQFATAYLEFARLQGRAYEELFSVRAQRASQEVRAQAIVSLDALFKSYWSKASMRFAEHPEFAMDADLVSERFQMEFTYYSNLCIIHQQSTKGIPPGPGKPPYSSACISFARACLSTIPRLRGATTNDSAYTVSIIHWLFLNYPLTPFFVLFASVVTTRNRDDLALMGDLVRFLEGFREKSNGIQKLYQLTKIFHRVATVVSQAPPGQGQASAPSNHVSRDSADTSLQPSTSALPLNPDLLPAQSAAPLQQHLPPDIFALTSMDWEAYTFEFAQQPEMLLTQDLGEFEGLFSADLDVEMGLGSFAGAQDVHVPDSSGGGGGERDNWGRY